MSSFVVLHAWTPLIPVSRVACMHVCCMLCRVQKQRAARSEDAVEQLNAQLLERDSQIAEYRTDSDNIRLLADKLAKEKAQIQAENSALQT